MNCEAFNNEVTSRGLLAISVALILFLSGCGEASRGPQGEAFMDLVSDFEIARARFDTEQIDHTNAPDKDEKEIWSNEPTWWTDYSRQTVTLRPSFSAQADVVMRIHWKEALSVEDIEKNLEIRCNGKSAAAVRSSEHPGISRCELPVDSTRVGRNEIIIRHTKPVEAFESGITLYESIAKVTFLSDGTRKISRESYRTDDKAEPTIFIPSRGGVAYYYRIPLDSTLAFSISPSRRLSALGRKMRTTIEANGEGGTITADFRIPVLFSKRIKLDLSQFGDKVCRVSFDAPDLGGVMQELALLHPRITSRPARSPSPNTNGPAESPFRNLNVVIILLDSLEACHLDSYGYARRTSPRISELAADSVVFDNAYSSAAYTLASTASLFTSRHPITHGILGKGDKLPEAAVTLADVLGENGVSTAMFTANEWVSDLTGLHQGFETYVEMYEAFDLDENIVWAEEFVPVFLEWAGARNGPFFAYLHLIQPHVPYTPPAPYDEAFDRNDGFAYECDAEFLVSVDKKRTEISDEDLRHIEAQYDENILYADHQVGRIVDGLEDLGIGDDTVVVVMSDHGEAFLEHGFVLHNQTVYHEMIHIPLIVRFPERCGIEPKRVDEIVSTVDVFPTLLDMFEIRHDGDDLAGNSLIPAIMAEGKAGDVAFSMTVDRKSFSLDDGRYKRIIGHFERLYDSKEDRREETDLLTSEAILAGYYRQMALDYVRQAGTAAHIDTPERAEIDRKSADRLKALGYLD